MNLYISHFFLGLLAATGCMTGSGNGKETILGPPAPARPEQTETTATERKREAKPFVVLELFTSEGCSSCPPAYEVMERTLERAREDNKNVMLLDFHVDYWNNPAWTDPYSSKANSDRQRRYSKVLFPEVGLYTPQLIVNGRKEIVGSDEVKVHRSVKTALDSGYTVELNIKKAEERGDSVVLEYEVSEIPENAMLNLALVQHEAKTAVTGGENAGRTLTHYNVVRSFSAIPLDARRGRTGIAKAGLPGGETYTLVAYVQNPGSMQIFAADSATPVTKKTARVNK